MSVAQLLAIPEFQKTIRNILLFLLVVIFLCMLYFGYSQFFIPFFLTLVVVFMIIATRVYETTNPILVILLIPFTFLVGYGVQKVLAFYSPEFQQAMLNISAPDTRIVAVILMLVFLLILYIYRCPILGICKR